MSTVVRKGFSRVWLFLGLSLVLVWAFAGLVKKYQDDIQVELREKIQEARLKMPKVKVDWHKISGTGHLIEEEDTRPSPFNSSKLAILIEPRPIPHLVPQILHMISVVPPDWKFLFIGSNQSVISVGRAWATKHQQKIGKLDVITLPEPWDISSKEGVFRLMTDIRFYDEFIPGVEWLLKYEHDSILCANAHVSLNQWLHWDWTGAPRTEADRFSGNGGLSLRRISAVRRILAIQNRRNNTNPEDEWFGGRVIVLPGAKVASAAEGQFAVEDTYMERPMGYHVRDGGNLLPPAVWRSREQRKAIFDYCPELSIIMNMKLERERCPGDNGEGEIVPPAPAVEPPATENKEPPAPPAAAPAAEQKEPPTPPAPSENKDAAPPAQDPAAPPSTDTDGFQIQEDSKVSAEELGKVLANNQNFDENNKPQADPNNTPPAQNNEPPAENGVPQAEPAVDADGFQIQDSPADTSQQ